jgi:hypothetical protein
MDAVHGAPPRPVGGIPRWFARLAARLGPRRRRIVGAHADLDLLRLAGGKPVTTKVPSFSVGCKMTSPHCDVVIVIG